MDSEEEISPRLSPILFSENGPRSKRIKLNDSNAKPPMKMKEILTKALQDPDFAQFLDDMKDEILVDLPPVTANVLECEKIPKVKNKHKTQILSEFKETNCLMHKAADKYANRKVYLYDVGSKDFVKLRNLHNKNKNSAAEGKGEIRFFTSDEQFQTTPPVPPRKLPLSPLSQETSSLLPPEKSTSKVEPSEEKKLNLSKDSSKFKLITNESLV